MSDFDNEDGPSTSADSSDSTTCPICHVILTGTAEERNSHAEACLTSGVSHGYHMDGTWVSHGLHYSHL